MYDKIYQYGQNTALYTDNGLLTYNDIISEGEKLAKKIKGNELCMIIANNNSATVIAYLALLHYNHPILLINKSNNINSIISILKKYKPSYVILDEQLCVHYDIKEIIDNCIKWYDDSVLLHTNFTRDYEINKDIALLINTSGSTGSSKFVKLSKENLLSNTDSIVSYLNISYNDKAITTLPFAYSYGLSIINTHLLSGASIVLSDYSIIQKEFWYLMKKYKATTFGGVPYIYEMLYRLRFSNMELENIKYVTQAGGRLNHMLSEYFYNACTEKNILFYKMYGQTEATARIAYLEPKFLHSKIDSIGKVIPNGDLFIVDEKGNLLKNNEQGELIYKGKNVSLGYVENCYDLYKGDENHGILYTGDIGYCDEDGFFYITGRKKRFLKLFGNRVSLDEIEELINSKGYNCACVGSDEKMLVYVEEKDNMHRVSQIIKENVDINPSGYKIEVIDKIPRNSAGKILYYKLG